MTRAVRRGHRGLVPIALCQPRSGPTCAACCGLYSDPARPRADLEQALWRRTELLAAAPRNHPGFWAVARRLLSQERPGGERLSTHAGLCPLLGFLDADRSRVGCLGHPASTGGPDLRDCGTHGAHTCEGFFCPACETATEDEAELARAVCGDWWLYGLVVTTPTFLQACLAAVTQAAGRRVDARELTLCAPAHEPIRRLLALRARLPRPFDPEPVELQKCAPPAAAILAAAGLAQTEESCHAVRALADAVARALVA